MENGQLKWLTDEAKPSSARVIVTIIEDTTSFKKRRVPPDSIKGKGKTLGDIVTSIVEEQDWKCLTSFEKDNTKKI